MDFTISNQIDLIFFLIILFIALFSLIITRRLLKVTFPYFFMGVLGVIIGMVVGSLLGKTLINLPGLYGKWLPIFIEVFVTVAMLDLFIAQARPLSRFLGNIFQSRDLATISNEIIVDTSVLIDGRIDEMAKAGFVSGILIIPRFVLLELQNIADSEEPLKRAKGRRGLEVLSDLQRMRQVKIEITDDHFRDRERVDSKLVKLAREKQAKILTIDYNLNRVAQIQGVEVLNINELAGALKPLLIPGENILVKVTQKGKEKRQGVGYLEDGTMIVVEGGDKFVGQEVECEVIRVFQTVAGKMIFVQPKNNR